MSSIWKWLKRIVGAAYILVAGALGAGGGHHLIVDRREMYGDDPTNDPYSPDFDPFRKPRR